jgi:hypothetical protein
MLGNHAPQAVVDGEEPYGEIRALVARERAAGDEAQAVALDRTTPQPVRRSPGSMPRMRIGRRMTSVHSPGGAAA